MKTASSFRIRSEGIVHQERQVDIYTQKKDVTHGNTHKFQGR